MRYFEQEAKIRFAKGHSLKAICASLRAEPVLIERVLLGFYVVRVVEPTIKLAAFVRCLEGAGLVHVHDARVFDILCPPTEISADWSFKLAKSLQDVGINAVQAPRWSEEV